MKPAGWGDAADGSRDDVKSGTVAHPTPDLRSDPPPPGEGTQRSSLDRFRRNRARDLRQRATPAERRLWQALDRLPLAGTHFRRQVPLGPYVVDFACLAAKLVIELDGPSHTEPGAAERDRARQTWLEAEGFRVLRFWNAEIDDNVDGVLDTIHAALHGGLATPPAPFRHRRRRTPPLSGREG